MNILLGVTGSVAACLTPKMIVALKEFGEVRVVSTDKGVLMSPRHWGGPIGRIPDKIPADLIGEVVLTDDMEWGERPWHKGDLVMHIELKNWADILVVAPCSANTLAKMANGLADNMLSCIVRAWPVHKPLFVAPSMNTDMWFNPVTDEHIRKLRKRYPHFTSILPQQKTLACGDFGYGAMADVDVIVNEITREMVWRSPFANPRQQLFIPKKKHPGSFGAVRKHDVHTGVDLYASDGDWVQAFEPGVVVGIVDFTGSKVLGEDGTPMTWWNDTQAVLVKGPSGIIVYGEIEPNGNLQVGSPVHRGGLGNIIGTVKAVLPPEKKRKDIPHHSNAMLHVELYTNETAEKNFRWKSWNVGEPRPEGLLDPTPFLEKVIG